MSATMRAVDPMIAELDQESTATRRMLERVPADKLDWAPHPKSMTLGQLAYHVAGL
jgi:DNA topoisomerase VI subunit B